MSKKVGIVSCYFKNNYGSMLQAYATQKILDDNNISNETIDISNLSDFKKNKRKFYISQITNFGFIKTKFGMIKLKLKSKLNKKIGHNFAIRNKKFEEFKINFHLTKSFNTYKDINSYSQKYFSDVVVGSDQLWLPVNIVGDYYTLNWVPENVNKISYATSFGIAKIPDKYKNQYIKFLNRIEHISVRENQGVDLINTLTTKKAKLVCDPTLLLTKEQWEEISSSEPIEKEKYIFCYFLGKNIEHRKFVERLKKETGYKIISINHCDEYVKYSDEFADETPYNVGPAEFINYIKNAEFVCTDSFHGTVFSLINNTKFFTFERFNKKEKMSTNSRIYSLLNIVNLENRLLDGTEDIKDSLNIELDFKKVNKKIAEFREESKKWFLESLTYQKEPEEKHIEIKNKENCCGCTACKNICPKGAIEMVPDEEGFLYPKVNHDKCIKCGLCKKVCPILNKQVFNTFEQKAFIFQNKKEQVRKDSTSGGFYSSLGEYVISNGGIVFGAAFDKGFKVNHEAAETIDELRKFRKSKYVQSNLKNTFKEVQTALNEGILVCYSGTPCQIAGLKSFLKKDYENLILMDLMCHSVPSPLYFEKYKEYILNKMKASKILDIDFRDKSKYGYKYSMMTVKTDNGIYSQGIDTDPYLRAFFGDYSVRPSCYKCKFKTQKRVSDITIWDCFNINEIDKEFDDDKGTTRILIQSEKGLKILKALDQTRIKEIPLDIAVGKVKEMTKSVNYNSKREAFYQDINKPNFIDEYFPINIKTRINSFIRKTLSATGLYSSIKTIAKKILRK